MQIPGLRTTGNFVGHSAEKDVLVSQHSNMRIKNLTFPDGPSASMLTDLSHNFHVFCKIESEKRIVGAFECQNATSTPRNDPYPRFGAPKFHAIPSNIPDQSNAMGNTEESFHRKRRQPYNWRSWNGLGTMTRSDARDAVYLYNYKMKKDVSEEDVSDSLPQIYQLKTRPQTVAESNPSAEKIGRGNGKLKQPRSANPERRKETVFQMARRDHLRSRDVRKHIAKYGNSGTDVTFSLEVQKYRSCSKRGSVSGKGGCLFSKVYQSFDRVKTATYRRRKTSLAPRIERPMKQEQGRYRPISRTIVKSPKRDDSPSAEEKDPKSAEAYKLFVQAHDLLRESSPAKAPSSRFRLTNNTAASHYHDTENRLLQSVIDVNKPFSRMTTPQSVTPFKAVNPLKTSRLSARNSSAVSDYQNTDTRLLQSVIDENKPLSRITTPLSDSPQSIHIPDTTYKESCETPVTVTET